MVAQRRVQSPSVRTTLTMETTSSSETPVSLRQDYTASYSKLVKYSVIMLLKMSVLNVIVSICV